MVFNSQNAKGFVRYSSIAFQMIAIIGLFTFAGWKLDQGLNNKFPVFVLILSLSGVFIGIYTAVKDFLKMGRNGENRENGGNNFKS